MKRADLRTGVVYAHNTSTYGDPDMIVLVDVENLWSTGRSRQGMGPAPWATRPGKLGHGFSDHETVGYPAFGISSAHDQDPATLLDERVNLDLLNRTAGSSQAMPEDLREACVQAMVVNPRYVLGQWSEVVAKRAAEKSAKQQRDGELKRKAAELVQVAQVRRERLAALGVHVPEPWLGYGRNSYGTQWETLHTRSLTLDASAIGRLLNAVDAQVRALEEHVARLMAADIRDPDGTACGQPVQVDRPCVLLEGHLGEHDAGAGMPDPEGRGSR